MRKVRAAMLFNLSPQERETLLELGRRGSGGNFDILVLSKLFTRGLCEIRSTDRRLVLTEAGRDLYRELSAESDSG
jgi:hypothetical protein